MATKNITQAVKGRQGFVPFLTPEQRIEIIRRYLSAQEKTGDLAKEFEISPSAINMVVRRSGNKLRPRCGVLHKLPIWHEAFENITPESAYWVGMLMTDGSVCDKRNTVTLALAIEDLEHVAKFKKFLKAGAKINFKQPNKKHSYISQVQCAITVFSKKMVSDLAQFGVVARKTKTAKTHILENDRDYNRGLIDGDGCITSHSSRQGHCPIIGLVGSKDVCEQFLAFTKNITPTKTKIICSGPNLWRVSIGGRHGYAIIRHLYNDAPIYLDRKYIKAHELLRRFENHLTELEAHAPSKYNRYYAAMSRTVSVAPPTLNPTNAAEVAAVPVNPAT